MTELAEQVLARLDSVTELYHRLVLLVAPSGSGKTKALQELGEQTGTSPLNLNLAISEKLLDLTERQRALRLPQVVEELVGTQASLLLLDDIELLFDISLDQDPLRLLQRLARNRTVVAAWNGTVDGDNLAYAAPEHQEYRRYPMRDLVVISPEPVA